MKTTSSSSQPRSRASAIVIGSGFRFCKVRSCACRAASGSNSASDRFRIGRLHLGVFVMRDMIPPEISLIYASLIYLKEYQKQRQIDSPFASILQRQAAPKFVVGEHANSKLSQSTWLWWTYMFPNRNQSRTGKLKMSEDDRSTRCGRQSAAFHDFKSPYFARCDPKLRARSSPDGYESFLNFRCIRIQHNAQNIVASTLYSQRRPGGWFAPIKLPKFFFKNCRGDDIAYFFMFTSIRHGPFGGKPWIVISRSFHLVK